MPTPKNDNGAGLDICVIDQQKILQARHDPLTSSILSRMALQRKFAEAIAGRLDRGGHRYCGARVIT